MDIVYDIETYPNVFTLCAEAVDAPFTWCFEISDYRNDGRQLVEWLVGLKECGHRMVGFNNVGFDYPVLHILTQTGKASAHAFYLKAQAIINSQDDNRFLHMVYPSDRFVEQLDLYKINHFDNKARATGLKVLEFNMRMDNISDLPFPVGSTLTPEQIEVLKRYNAHDVRATKEFYFKNLEQIKFREDLTRKHGRDFMNHSDVKIGKEIFQMELEKSGVECYTYGANGRSPRQTYRPVIDLGKCIPKFVRLENPEFNRIKNYLSQQVITETKGVFNDLTATIAGLTYVFGSGGLHASVENQFFESDDDYTIIDLDVTSLYPSIAIGQGYYPEHLGPRFVEVYKSLKEQRVAYKKGTAENAMLKLALNGVYGASNDRFSVFYDPLFTMKITIGGQMMIAMLAEQLCKFAKVIQCNTDGISLWIRKCDLNYLAQVAHEWELLTGLTLEMVEYTKMAIRDVNNYIAVKTDGSVKRKGAYEYEMEWHQDHSALVIPKVVEKVLVDGVSIRQTVESWPDLMDFMLRVKVPKSSRLVGESDGRDIALENTQRYYVSTEGVMLVKIMPPLAKNPTVWRRIGVQSGWTVCPCNDIRDATAPVNFEWYISEIEKLVLGVM